MERSAGTRSASAAASVMTGLWRHTASTERRDGERERQSRSDGIARRAPCALQIRTARGRCSDLLPRCHMRPRSPVFYSSTTTLLALRRQRRPPRSHPLALAGSRREGRITRGILRRLASTEFAPAAARDLAWKCWCSVLACVWVCVVGAMRARGGRASAGAPRCRCRKVLRQR
jgi:hypothetical protein